MRCHAGGFKMRLKTPFLILLVLIAGCASEEVNTAPPTACTPEISQGLDITNFYSESPQLESGEQSKFILDLQNFGAAPVSNAKAELYNTGGFKILNNDPAIKDIQAMDAPAEGYEPTEEIAWDLEAPETGLTNTIQATIGVRIQYDYKSTAQANAIYVPKDEWKVMQQQGQAFVDSSPSCSNGPVGISVEPLNPIVTQEGGTKEFALRVNIQNLGTGRVWSTAGLDKIDSVQVQLDPSLGVVDADACPDFNIDKLPILSLKTPVKLSIGEQKTLSCKLLLNDAPAKRQNYPIIAEATYRYRSEATVPITVTTQGHTVYMQLNNVTPAVITATDFQYVQGGVPITNWSLSTKINISTKPEYPKYDSECTAEFNNTDKAKWTAIIQNGNTKAYAPVLSTVTGTCATGFTAQFNRPADTVSQQLCNSPSRITLKVDYKTYPTSKTWSGKVNVIGC